MFIQLFFIDVFKFSFCLHVRSNCLLPTLLSGITLVVNIKANATTPCTIPSILNFTIIGWAEEKFVWYGISKTNNL